MSRREFEVHRAQVLYYVTENDEQQARARFHKAAGRKRSHACEASAPAPLERLHTAALGRAGGRPRPGAGQRFAYVWQCKRAGGVLHLK